MKPILSEIERALKRLYNLDSTLRVEDFLIPKPLQKEAPPGALYICPSVELDGDLGLGVYLSPSVVEGLETSAHVGWPGSKLAAFGVAAEEISHFHYIAHHAPTGRAVSHLELELQGEVDKFLLTFFASGLAFGELFDKFFERFSLVEGLSSEQQMRYAEASQIAKSFLKKHVELISDPAKQAKFIAMVRAFYRLGLRDKISQATR